MAAPRAFGRFVFERYWLAVEVISVLLLLGLLAAVLVGFPVYYTLSAWQSTYVPRLAGEGVSGSFWNDLLTSPNGLAQIGTYFDERLNPALLHFIQHETAESILTHYTDKAHFQSQTGRAARKDDRRGTDRQRPILH